MKIANKIVIGLIVLVAATGLSNASMSVGWTGASDGVLWDHNGTAAAMNDTWTFELIADMNGNIASTATAGSLDAGDVILQTATWNQNSFPGWGSVANAPAAVADTYAGKNVYFMFFNASSTYLGYIYNTTSPDWTLPAVSVDPLQVSIDVSTPGTGPSATGNTGVTAPGDSSGPGTGTGTGWQANIQVVPEPTSMALFGLGGLLIGLRRKLRKA